jgi:glycosyltransferase involved in cell wall biosynthesis
MTLDLVIATYNRSSLLHICLESAFLAERPDGLNIKIVIVDNGSSDDTRGVVQRFIERDELHVEYIFVGRPGKAAALNDALAQTDGEIVGLIDDDEQVKPDWFSIVHHEFSSAPALDFIGGQCYPNWESPAPDWIPKRYSGAIGIVLNPTRVDYGPEFPGILMGGNSAIRRPTLDRVLPYPEGLGKIGNKIRSGEDEVIYHRLLAVGARGVNIPELIIYHWIPAERLTRRYFRRWVIGRGISVGSQFHERGFREASFLGIPRYQLRTALRSIIRVFTGKSKAERFTAQLSILDYLATLYGRHFYR